MPELVRKTVLPQLHGLGKARDLRGGLCAGAQTHLLSAAGKQRPGLPHPGTDVQCADALGAADLVAGDGDKVRPQRFRGEGDLQKALHRVGVEQRFFIDRLQPPGDLRNGIDIAKLVVYHHNGHQRRVRPHCREHGLCGNVAICVRQKAGDLPALLL